MPKYHFRPKHHFVRHIPGDIERCGPMRHIWCFSFEGYYRRVKKWLVHSNRISELMHAGTMLSLQCALSMRAAWEESDDDESDDE